MLVGFHYNNNEYFYSRDLTGNIAKVLDVNGNIKVEYKYNAWGKILSITGDNTIKNVNSYLYKGYYYDFETELYYCNSRYYDPDVCRWISIDESSFLDYQNIAGINLWCYCGNNPVMRYDPDGYWSWKKFLLGVAITAVVTVAVALTIVTAGTASAIVATGIATYSLTTTASIAIAATATAGLIESTIRASMPSKEEHYNRNQYNTDLPEDKNAADAAGWNNGVAANAHQFSATGGRNIKYVSPDGKKEVIYDSNGNMVIDPRDIGTYNYCPSGGFIEDIGHFVQDVWPWILWGNTPEDSTNLFQRLWGLFFG